MMYQREVIINYKIKIILIIKKKYLIKIREIAKLIKEALGISINLLILIVLIIIVISKKLKIKHISLLIKKIPIEKMKKKAHPFKIIEI